MGIYTPTIGLMTIPYYMEIMGVQALAHIIFSYTQVHGTSQYATAKTADE